MARPRDDAVVERMLDIAEEMYAERGLEGVSLREISSKAGSGNSAAVQYHFGDSAGIITAILRRGMAAIDRDRRQRLQIIVAEGWTQEVDILMRAMFLPIFGHQEDAARRKHARFMLALLNSHQAHRWGKMFHDLQPSAVHALRLLCRAVPLSPIVVFERQRLVAIMVLSSIFNRTPHLLDPGLDRQLIENVLAMATAAMTAPVDDAAFVPLEEGDILSRGFRGMSLSAG